ncbi:hypothetical protein [Streptomyces sp. Act143]|uniref:hypothetical protein n=1 Tax=Streptomyces sp. Act143 TaxID=2200760 RepID=UPI0011B52D68|nr:hypothetical protein [Streptomyces sp. Act143]
MHALDLNFTPGEGAAPDIVEDRPNTAEVLERLAQPLNVTALSTLMESVEKAAVAEEKIVLQEPSATGQGNQDGGQDAEEAASESSARTDDGHSSTTS